MSSADDNDFDSCLARIGLTESQRRNVSPAIRDAFNHIRRREDRAAVFGAAASDAVICQRCYGVARYADAEGDECVCPRCGILRWEWKANKIEPTPGMGSLGGWFPVAPKTVTGYYVDNPHPYAGLREPARIWVEGKPIT